MKTRTSPHRSGPTRAEPGNVSRRHGWAVLGVVVLIMAAVGCTDAEDSTAGTTIDAVVTSTTSTTTATDDDDDTTGDRSADQADSGEDSTAAAGSEQALEFFRDTRTACADHADRTGNPVVPDQWFDDATVSENLGGDRWLIIDGGDNRLVVDTAEGVVHGEEGRDAVLPMEYSFGCPETLYLGSLDH